MTTVFVHQNHELLPKATAELIPVQLYGLNGRSRGDISTIGSPVVEKIKRLGVQVSSSTMDFLTIALAVTAADTFVKRKDTADGWAREITLKLPLANPELWISVKEKLIKALRFLSGDIWHLDFLDGGFAPPVPYRRRDRFHLTKLRGLDCVCLFSGGLDSAIGAIDLLDEGRKPLLVSHAYKSDKKCQDAIAKQLGRRYSRFAVNAYPLSSDGKTDISMRTRSINFLAFGALGGCAVQIINQMPNIELFVPENGFISLNAPLTTRRIGSLSTRTAHPHFLSLIQDIFDSTGIHSHIKNRYQFHTKGEMVLSCKNQALLDSVFEDTVSCSHWKRSNQQCGCCIPCIIRRASLKKGSFNEQTKYHFNKLVSVLSNVDRRDDLLALSIAISQMNQRPIGPWILDSGPLPPHDYEKLKAVFIRGLQEIELFFHSEGVL